MSRVIAALHPEVDSLCSFFEVHIQVKMFDYEAVFFHGKVMAEGKDE